MFLFYLIENAALQMLFVSLSASKFSLFWGVEQERALDREKPQKDAHPVAVKVSIKPGTCA